MSVCPGSHQVLLVGVITDAANFGLERKAEPGRLYCQLCAFSTSNPPPFGLSQKLTEHGSLVIHSFWNGR